MKLTKTQIKILTAMRDMKNVDEGELVYAGGRTAYLGITPVAPRTLNHLIRTMLIRNSGSDEDLERYRISGIGEQVLKDQG